MTGVIAWLWTELPEVGLLQEIHLQQPLRIYSADGELIGEFGEKIRQPIALDRLPRHVIDAFLASEDSRFLEHSGVDFIGLARAAWATAITLRIGQGASTITMQVARNYFLNREKKLIRKLREILLAIKIERELSKNQILELYLNRIFFGHRAYGIEAAAQVYYGKSATMLSIAEAAMIAGIPQRPSKDNPILNPKSSLERRNNYVLPRMRQLGMITDEQLEQALSTPESARFHLRRRFAAAGHFVELVRLKLNESYDEIFFESGHRVYTTLNSRYQHYAARALRSGIQDYELRQGYRGLVGHIDDYAEEGDEPPLAAELLARLMREQALPDDLRYAVVTPAEDGLGLLTADGDEALLDIDSLAPVLKAAKKTAEGLGDWLPPGSLLIVQPLGDGAIRLAQLPSSEAALYSMDPHTGAVRAMVGGYGQPGDHFNRATKAQRQVGSLFKPFLYSAALANGYSPATVVNDTNVSFDDAALEDEWRPSNYENQVYGPTLLREALVRSRNLVSVRLLDDLGIGATRRWMHRFGFVDDKQVPKNLTMALGSGALSPEQLSRGLALFANGGHLIEPWYIERIEDAQGRVIFRQSYAVACQACVQGQNDSSDYLFPQEEVDGAEAAGQPQASASGVGADSLDAANGELGVSKVEMLQSREEYFLKLDKVDTGQVKHRISQAENTLDPRLALLVSSMMNDVIKRGTGWRAFRELRRIDLYGKTGTTNDFRDAWFAGFHPRLLTTVWVGRDDNGTLGRNEAGGKTALPLWIEYMRAVLPELDIEQIGLIDGVQMRRVSKKTGELTSADDKDSYFEYFLSESLPPDPAQRGNGSPESIDSQNDALEELF